MTAALAVVAVVLAIDGRGLLAGLCLGLAIATKQWAVLAIFPVLMALPSRRWSTLLIALGIPAVLYAPGLLFAPSAFSTAQGTVASGGTYSMMWSAIYPIGETGWIHIPYHAPFLSEHVIPPLIRPLTHPLIVALWFLIPLGIWLRDRRFGLDPDRALALFALLALLRCCLDPIDNLYYHAPLLLSLLAWDAISPAGRLPLRGLLGIALAIFFWRWSNELTPGPEVFNLVYCLVALAATIVLTRFLLRRPSGALAGVLELEMGDVPVRVRDREEVADARGVDPLAML
jgi:hypothetical protein